MVDSALITHLSPLSRTPQTEMSAYTECTFNELLSLSEPLYWQMREPEVGSHVSVYATADKT